MNEVVMCDQIEAAEIVSEEIVTAAGIVRRFHLKIGDRLIPLGADESWVRYFVDAVQEAIRESAIYRRRMAEASHTIIERLTSGTIKEDDPRDDALLILLRDGRATREDQENAADWIEWAMKRVPAEDAARRRMGYID